jgi:signal transduction histidine kinase
MALQTVATDWFGPGSRGRALGLTAAVGIVYFLTAHFSLALLVAPDGVAAFWPAAGVSSGLLIALGPKARWPVVTGVFAATLAANLTGDRDVWGSAVFGVANAAEAVITAGLVHHYFPEDFNLGQLRQVFGFLVAAIVGTAMSGLIGSVGYKFFHSPTVPMLITWWHWIASDAIGIIAVAPLIIKITISLRDPPTPGGAIEGLASLAVLVAITGGVISLPEGLWKTTLPAALLFPVLLWLAVRCRLVFASAGAFIVSLSVVWTATLGIGHFGDPELTDLDRLMQAQAIILVVTIGTYVLAALFAERRESAARLANSYTLLEHERDSKLLNVEAAVALVSHELSQPLTGILSSCGAALRFLETTPPDQQRAETALRRVEDQARRLHEAFDGIRAVFRSSKEPAQPVDVNEAIRRVAEPFREELSRRSIALRLELASNLPPVAGNASQLQQVISNLVWNATEALEATEGRPRELRVSTELYEQAIKIAVEDSGPGIDPAKLIRIFDAGFTTKREGMGLGLAICRLIIERQGGNIAASSDGRSRTVFNVILPLVSTSRIATPDAVGTTSRPDARAER